jgi:hypothetical protein
VDGLTHDLIFCTEWPDDLLRQDYSILSHLGIMSIVGDVSHVHDIVIAAFWRGGFDGRGASRRLRLNG